MKTKAAKPAPMAPNTSALPRRRLDEGLTLIEFVAAIGVVSTALLANLTMVLYGIQSKEARRELVLARQEAAGQLEAMKAVSDPTDGAVTFSDHVVLQMTGTLPSGYTTIHAFSVDGLSNPSTTDGKGKGTIHFSTANPDLLEVSIRIDWNGVRPESHYEVRSLIGRGYTP